MKKTTVAAAALLLLATLTSASAAPAGAAPSPSVPPGFNDQLVAPVSSPTAIAFLPDGRGLVASQGGVLHLLRGDNVLATPALDLTGVICDESERGLLGVAVDPLFAENSFVYVYYTFKNGATCPFSNPSSPVNRVSRFVMTRNTIDPASETVLIDKIPSFGGNHNAGDLHFGKDGYLYISVGDGGCDYAGGGCAAGNNASRDQFALLGKILRVTRNGDAPPTNPFLGPDSRRCAKRGVVEPGHTCRETFAWGLRNPFRIAMDPNAATTEFRINDTGQDTWEEIDQGVAGADYGWNVREGHCATGSTTNCGAPPPGMTNPIYDYQHGGCFGAITGGAFVPNGVWPADYDGDYMFADLNCGTIYRLEPDGVGGQTRTTFAAGVGSPTALAFGRPGGGAQALYYLTYANGGEVHRITAP